VEFGLWLLLGARHMNDDADKRVRIHRIACRELDRTEGRSGTRWADVATSAGAVAALASVLAVKGNVLWPPRLGVHDAILLGATALLVLRTLLFPTTLNRLPPRTLRAVLLRSGKCPACAYPLPLDGPLPFTQCAECGARWNTHECHPVWPTG